MGGLQASQAVRDSALTRKPVPTFVNLRDAGSMVNIDPYDNEGDISHRDAVNLYVYAQCPAAKEVSLNFAQKIDAVNYSMGLVNTVDNLSTITQYPLTRNNLDKYRDRIAAWLRPPMDKDGHYDLSKIDKYLSKLEKYEFPEETPIRFTQLEDITKRGIPVFVSGGNYSREQVNLFGFAKGVISVGVVDKSGKKLPNYADNSLITMRERGKYPIVQIRDKQGNILGYNITGGQNVEIPLSQTTGRPPAKKSKSLAGKQLLENVGNIEGSSFVSPTALGKFLRQKYGKGCDLN